MSAPTVTARRADAQAEVGKLIARNNHRRFLAVQNKSATATLSIHFLGHGDATIDLGPGQYWEPNPAPANDLCVSATGPCPYVLIEG